MFYRGRRLRKNPVIRQLTRETQLSPLDFVYPIFVAEGENLCQPIPSMPGVFRWSVDRLGEVLARMEKAGVGACLLFGIPDHKDEIGSAAWDENGVVQRAMAQIRRLSPEMYIIGDVCMCEYTSHGHCGILDETGYVKNDETLGYLCRIAVSYARAGADMVAPSDMMDGHIQAIRSALDEAGFVNTAILGYSAKFASGFYGPFRDAADSAPAFGDRKAYQMDPANGREALREIEADIREGADMVMVKPAMPYLDILKAGSEAYNIPFAAYQVSGEYSMLKKAMEEGLLPPTVVEESLIALKRAGARWLITYFALEVGEALQNR